MGSPLGTVHDAWRRHRTTSLRLTIGAATILLGWLSLQAIFGGYKGPRIAFYGQVIDGGGRPIPGILVEVEVIQRTSAGGMGRPVDVLPITTTTASDGRFEISGVRGVEVRLPFYRKYHYFTVDDPRCATGPFVYDEKYLRETSRSGPIFEPRAERPAVFVVRPVP